MVASFKLVSCKVGLTSMLANRRHCALYKFVYLLNLFTYLAYDIVVHMAPVMYQERRYWWYVLYRCQSQCRSCSQMRQCRWVHSIAWWCLFRLVSRCVLLLYQWFTRYVSVCLCWRFTCYTAHFAIRLQIRVSHLLYCRVFVINFKNKTAPFDAVHSTVREPWSGGVPW